MQIRLSTGHWWHDTDEKTEVLIENLIPATLSIIKLPWIGPESNLAIHSKRLANYCLSCDTASLKPEIHHSSQQIHFLSITKTNFLMMLREITAIFYEHCMQHIAGAFPLYASTSMPATLSTNVHMTHAVNHHQECSGTFRTSNTEVSAFNPPQQTSQAKPKSKRDADLHQALGACQHPLVCLAIPAFDHTAGLGKNSLYHNWGFWLI